jgi:hypothetical protein
MDPKKLAEEILNQLFETEELVEAKETEEEMEEDEGEDEEGHEEEETGEEEHEEQKGKTSNASTLNMKSSPTQSAGGSKSAVDFSGKGNQPWPGVGEAQEFETTGVSAEANRATRAMKPSFAGVEMPSMNKEKVQEDVKTLFGADVSEEFIEKASSLYEASLNTNLQSITEQMANLFEEKLAEQTMMVAEELENKINDYLSYVVEEWINENELAVENGLRTEIAESFIEGLKNLFVESYIEIPEDKTNIFDEMTDAIENLETRVNEEMERNISLREKVALLEATAAFEEETKSLKSIDVQNLRKLAENVEFSSVEDFRSKVKVLVENYSKAKSTPVKSVKTAENTAVGAVIDNLMEETEQNEEQQFINESIKMYSDVLGRTLEG